MILEMKNQRLAVRVSDRGAELQSLYSLPEEKEYIWQPGAEIFDGHAPILFPAAGRIDRSRVFIRGREYPMSMHGFVKDRTFSVMRVEPDSLLLELASDPELRRVFPYAFRLQVEYRLHPDRLEQTFRVYNDGEDDLFFSLGAHPAFYCPVTLGESADDTVIRFDKPQHTYRIGLEPGTRLCTKERYPWLQGETDIPLTEHFFDNGPILSGGYDAEHVTLLSRRSGAGIRMGIRDFPYMTFWGPPQRLSLICLEPWCGLSDFSGGGHVWERKIASNSLEPRGIFIRNLTFSPVSEAAASV